MFLLPSIDACIVNFSTDNLRVASRNCIHLSLFWRRPTRRPGHTSVGYVGDQVGRVDNQLKGFPWNELLETLQRSYRSRKSVDVGNRRLSHHRGAVTDVLNMVKALVFVKKVHHGEGAVPEAVGGVPKNEDVCAGRKITRTSPANAISW